MHIHQCAVVCMSILLQNTNAQCNYLQGILGVFFHSTCVPQKVINVLNHAGLSISQTSINHAVKSMSREIASCIRSAVGSLKASFAYDNFDINFKTHQPTIEHHSIFTSATSATSIPLFGVEDPNDLQCSAELWACNPRNPSLTETPWIVSDDDLFQLHMDDTYSKKGASNTPSPHVYAWAWHVRNILINHGPKHFAKFAHELGRPDTVFQIPVHKTHQIPCRSMKIKQSITDGNVEVVENLLKQGGIGDPAADEEFDLEHDVDMSEHVIVVHGDLLTKERLDIACESCCIEDTPKNRLQFIIFLPGLFHYKMACADALWRTHIQPKDGRDDEDSMFQHICILRPNESNIIGSKPGFRQMHDVIHHDLWAVMLDCWHMEVSTRNSQWTSLDKFAELDPKWDDIVEISMVIVSKYVAGGDMLRKARRAPSDQRDQVFENQML